jgi:hypothetical protein
MSDKGFSLEDLKRSQMYFTSKGCETIIVHLNEYLPDSSNIEDIEEKKFLNIAKTDPAFQAYVLIARNGITCLGISPSDLLTEMLFYKWDSKYYHANKQKVLNKLARHNLNFDDVGQKALFEEGKGTTVSWSDVPLLRSVKKGIVKSFGKNTEELKCEGNKYYVKGKTGIGRHGDGERRKVRCQYEYALDLVL